jgi:hypothetical protein
VVVCGETAPTGQRVSIGPQLDLTDVDGHHGHHAVQALPGSSDAQSAEVLAVVDAQQAR